MSNYLDILLKNGFNPDKLTEDQLLYLDLAMTRPKTPDELWNYVALFFGVKLPRNKVCEGCCAPFDAFANSYFADDPVSIWLANRGGGKAQPLSSLVLHTSGYKTMGDTKVGDIVIDHLGKPTQVVAVHPQGVKKILKVSFNDRTSTRCTEDHLWLVKRPGWVKFCHGKRIVSPKLWEVKSAQELKDNLKYPRGDFIWRVPMTEPVQLPERELKIDPWLLGAILGDGSIKYGPVGFTTADADMARMVAESLPEGCSLTKISSEYGYGIVSDSRMHYTNHVREALRHYGLLGTGSWTKFVPDDYLYGSIDQRLAILQGLLDTDGYSTCKGVEYSSASDKLAEAVVFLVQSLGGTAVRCKLKVVNGSSYHRIRIKMAICPFRLQRKIDAWRAPTKYPTSRIITNIEEDGYEEAQCITVASPEHTYLTNDCIVTHNSISLALLGMVTQVTLGCNINILGGSAEQSERILAYIRGSASQCGGMFWDADFAPKYLIDPREENKKTSKLYNNGIIKCLTASSQSVRGPHVQRILEDEIDCAEYQIIEDSFSQSKSDFKRDIKKQITLSSTWQNPDGTMTKMMRRARDNGWPIFKWCWRECVESNGGWLPDSEIESMRRTVSEETFKREYDNQEPHGTGRIWAPEHIDRYFNKRLGEYKGKVGERIRIQDPDPEQKFYHGADWAKKQDSTIITTFMSRINEPDLLANWMRMEKMDWNAIISEFNNIIRVYGGPAASDATGIGNVIQDMIEFPCKPVDFRQKKLIQDILTDYVVAIENGELEAPYIEHAYFEHKYATWDQLYGNDHLPDTIASAALAWHMRKTGMFNFLICRI